MVEYRYKIIPIFNQYYTVTMITGNAEYTIIVTNTTHTCYIVLDLYINPRNSISYQHYTPTGTTLWSFIKKAIST